MINEKKNRRIVDEEEISSPDKKSNNVIRFFILDHIINYLQDSKSGDIVYKSKPFNEMNEVEKENYFMKKREK